MACTNYSYLLVDERIAGEHEQKTEDNIMIKAEIAKVMGELSSIIRKGVDDAIASGRLEELLPKLQVLLELKDTKGQQDQSKSVSSATNSRSLTEVRCRCSKH